MKRQKKTHGLAYKIFTTILLLVLLGGFCTVQAICNVVSKVGLIWFALLFINFVLMALEDFNCVKTRYGKIPVRQVSLALLIVIVGIPVYVMLPIGSGWRPYTFESERATIEAARAVPDEQNAALLYQPLFDDIGAAPELPECVKDCEKVLLRGPWSPETYPEVAAWLQTNNNTIEKVMQISEVYQCRFPIQTYYSDFSDWFGRSAQQKYLVRLLLISANLDITQHNKDAALAKYSAAINIGNHHLQQPVVLDFLIGLGTKALALRPVRTFIMEDATEEDIMALAEQIELQNTWNKHWPEMLEVEILQLKNHIGRFYEVNPSGRTRLTHHLSTAPKPGIPPSAQDRLRDMFAPAFFVFVMPWRPPTAGQIIDEIYAPLAREDFDWNNLADFEKHCRKTSRPLGDNWDFFIKSTLPASVLSKVHDIYLGVLAVQRGTHILIALKDFNTSQHKWPENLVQIAPTVPTEALIDPTNGGEFVYTPSDDGFMLYSKGKNGVDENGEKDRKTGADDVLVWPVGD